MSAGLPGLGLGGLFFILSALIAPFIELGRAARGRSSPAARRAVARQFAQAVLMIVAIDLTLRLAFVGLSAFGLGDPPRSDVATVLPLTLIGITVGILALVLCSAKAMAFVLRPRTAALPPVPAAPAGVAPLRAILLTGAVAGAWFVLLGFGASDLSPLSAGGDHPEAASPGLGANNSPEEPTIVARSGGRAQLLRPPAAARGVSLVRHAERGRPPASSRTGRAPQGQGAPASGIQGQAVQPTTGSAADPGSGSSAGIAPAAASGPSTSPGANGSGGGPPSDAGPPAGSSAPPETGPPADTGPSASTPAEGKGLGQAR